MTHIVDLMLADLNKRLADQGIRISLTEEAKEYVVREGYDPVYGARPLKRYIQQNVETLAAKIILRGEMHEGSTIVIEVKGGELDGFIQGPVSVE